MASDQNVEALCKLALQITPSKEYLGNASEMAGKIAELLQQKSRFAIGQICMAGSLGKRTTIIIGSDIDIVVFINDEQPPFDEVIDEFDDILNTSDSYGIRDVRTTKYSIQFKAGGFDFDLLPAVNFVVDLTGKLDSDELIDMQQKRTLDFIKVDPKKYGYMYSGSLAQANVRFMKRQDGFVNEMVRIAKYWFKSLYFEEYTSGAKMLVELVAVFAARNEINKYNERSYLRCFADIIRKLQDFEQLDIVFQDEYKLPEHQLPNVGTKDGPRVMDPANPYNNLAENWRGHTKEMVKRYAAETYRRLQGESKSPTAPFRLDVVFDPQPTLLPFVVGVFGQAGWLVGTYDDANPQLGLKIRREAIEDQRIGVELVKIYLYTAWSNFMAAPFERSLQKVFEQAVDKHVLNRNTPWVTADRKHEDYDGTFTFPEGPAKLVRISFKFNL